MAKEIKTKVIYTARENVFVIKWKEGTRWRQRKAEAKTRQRAEREAAKLEDELRKSKKAATEEGWEAFKLRYEVEVDMKQSTCYIWDAVCKRLEAANPDIRKVEDVTASAISKMMAQCRKDGLADTTITGYVKHLRTGLRWGHDIDGTVSEVPKVKMPKVNRGAAKMRSRPVTEKEFKLMLKTVPKVRKHDPEPWRNAIRAMYYGGLRVGEVAILSTDWRDDFAVLVDHDPPVFKIKSEGQKNSKDQMVPMTPEFFDFIKQIAPPKDGRVFHELPTRSDNIGKVIREIGEAAGIVVNDDGKYASAHDLRRAFGTRWSRELTPADLKVIMRHADIKTTMAYYVGVDVKVLSKTLWKVQNK